MVRVYLFCKGLINVSLLVFKIDFIRLNCKRSEFELPCLKLR